MKAVVLMGGVIHSSPAAIGSCRIRHTLLRLASYLHSTEQTIYTILSGCHIHIVEAMDPDVPVATDPASPPVWRWVLGFLAVGAAW